MNYVIGIDAPGPKSSRLGAIQNVENTWQLNEGVSRADDFPSDATYTMDRSYPKGIALDDAIDNLDSLLVVSEHLRRVAFARDIHGVEWLPVRIVNHKGRTENAPYFILHPVGLQDCLDRSRSDFDENPLDPEKIMTMRKLVIDETRVHPDAQVFRIRHHPRPALFRRDLAEAISAANCTGIRFIEIDQWEL